MNVSPLSPPPPLARDAALFLDFDGTLVEIADRPDAVSVDPELKIILLRLLEQQVDRVALVSGRSIAQLDGFFGDLARNLTLIGSHGAEIRPAGMQPISPSRPAFLDEAAAAFADTFADRPGVVIEDKSFGVAIHYRQVPEAEAAANIAVERFAEKHGVAVQKGKLMVELCLPDHDKGMAIEALMNRKPFAGHTPVFLGDDLTDETGFAVCEAHRGMGILIGAPRPSYARYVLNDVTAVRVWLGGSGT